MIILNIFKFPNGNELLVYKDEHEPCGELHYYNHATDEDTYICEVAEEFFLINEKAYPHTEKGKAHEEENQR